MDATTLFQRHLSLYGRPARPEELEIYAEDVVLELPYAPEGHTARKEGRDELAGFLARIGDYFGNIRVGEPKVMETADGLVAEYTAQSVYKENGRPYAQDYVTIVTLRDGKIARVREYYDPLRVLKAIGELD